MAKMYETLEFRHSVEPGSGWRNKSRAVSHLREERPLVLGLLDAVGHQPLHGLGTVLVELAEVWRQIASSHHEDDLTGGGAREGERARERDGCRMRGSKGMSGCDSDASVVSRSELKSARI